MDSRELGLTRKIKNYYGHWIEKDDTCAVAEL
jgi:hypothetical protein